MQGESRIPGFHQKTPIERAQEIAARLSNVELSSLLGQQTLSLSIAERLSENVVSVFGLPLSVATNFLINGRDVLVPMSVEEPSVVAAASFGAKLARSGGGFQASSDPAEMIGQIELRGLADLDVAMARVRAAEPELLALVNNLHPRLVARGGGAIALSLRPIDPRDGHAVCELIIDCRDAMGANLINTSCEALAEPLSALTGGQVGLRILSNYCDRRRARARCEIPCEAFGEGVAEAIELASRFAERDVWRAVTHNKGFMNGVDALVVATGNDWRAVEAAAHASAVKDGVYRPLARWFVSNGKLVGEAELPLALGTVGGATEAHPGARLAMEILGRPSSRELAEITVAVGLAQNLSALRALATEGIQKGHMALHARRLAPQAEAKAQASQEFSPWIAQRALPTDKALRRFFEKKRIAVTEKTPELLPVLESLAEFTFRGGKRFRAALSLLSYELNGGGDSNEGALLASLALEFLQSALLIQEDLIEGDMIRRGGPSLQHLLASTGETSTSLGLSMGAARALLVSDLAHTFAKESIIEAPLPAERRLAALEELLSLERESLGGKWRDLALDPRDAREEDVLRAYELRSIRYTTQGPLRLGARLAGAEEQILLALDTFAKPLGLAYQLRDDVLRVFGETRDTGRSSAGELRTGRPRLLLVEALRLGTAAEVARLRALFAQRFRSEEEVAEVKALLFSTGAKQAVEDRLMVAIAEASKAAQVLPFASQQRAMLVALAEYVGNRTF